MTLILHAPQIIYLLLVGLAIVLTAIRHGKPQGNHDVWSTLTAILVQILLMKWGGFFG